MTPKPDVSVVIPTRNRRPLLAEALESVKLQEGIRWEVLVVDDHSTDDTWNWLQGLNHSSIRSLRLNSPARQAVARNLGLGEARGRYCLFLDDDDLLKPNALRTLADALDRKPNSIAAIGAREDWFTDQGYRRRDIHPWWPQSVDISHLLLAGWCAVPGQVLLRTAIVREINGFEPATVPCEDRDLLHRSAMYGKVLLHPVTVLTYRIEPTQWRPKDIREIREKVARNAIRKMPAKSRRKALRTRRMVAHFYASEDGIAQGFIIKAFVDFLKGMYQAPWISSYPWLAIRVLRRLGGRLARRTIAPKSVMKPAIDLANKRRI
jgi:glycosyltransferase involved in cell wall biosynthesis